MLKVNPDGQLTKTNWMAQLDHTVVQEEKPKKFRQIFTLLSITLKTAKNMAHPTFFFFFFHFIFFFVNLFLNFCSEELFRRGEICSDIVTFTLTEFIYLFIFILSSSYVLCSFPLNFHNDHKLHRVVKEIQTYIALRFENILQVPHFVLRNLRLV
jgi:hypothetical protein